MNFINIDFKEKSWKYPATLQPPDKHWRYYEKKHLSALTNVLSLHKTYIAKILTLVKYYFLRPKLLESGENMLPQLFFRGI